MTPGKQDDALAALQADVEALRAIVTSLQADVCGCREIASKRRRATDDAHRSKLLAIAHVQDREERNRKIAALSPTDLESMLRQIGDDAVVRLVTTAPDHETQDKWLAIVSDPIALRRSRVHTHALPERVRVTARQGNERERVEIHASTVVISREQYDQLHAAGFDTSRISTETGYVADEVNPYKSHVVHRYRLALPSIDKSHYWQGTRELFDLLCEVSPPMRDAITHGQLIVTPLSLGENKIAQIQEDVSRGPDAQRSLERLPLHGEGMVLL